MDYGKGYKFLTFTDLTREYNFSIGKSIRDNVAVFSSASHVAVDFNGALNLLGAD